jgi:dienelactone hydrolase
MGVKWLPPGWRSQTFTDDDGHERTYYETGPRSDAQAGSVLLLHEFPGISENLQRFADELAIDHRVVIPSIVGRDGHAGNLGSFAQICIRREIHVFRTGQTSPAVAWLRALADRVVARDGKPYGVVGMCMSGGFALAIAVDPRVRAVVVAQPVLPLAPALPVPIWHNGRRAVDLGLSLDDRRKLERRVEDDDGLCVRAYRFRRDRLSPAVRMQSLETLLDGAVQVSTLDEPDPTGHSTLTKDRNLEAVAEVRKFLRDRLVT